MRAGAAMMIFALLLAGCRRPEPSLPDWTRANPAPAAPDARFAELLAIGREAETAARGLLSRTEFFPKHRRDARRAVAPLLPRLARLQRQPLNFAFAPTGLATTAPGRSGWRLIGRVLAWSLADAISAKSWPVAVERWRMATRLGFDVTGGGAADATLGLAIADDARREIAPALPTMPRPALLALAAAAARTLTAKPTLESAIRNEASNRRLVLATIQDAYAAGRLDSLRPALGSAAEDDLARVARGSRSDAAAQFARIGQQISDLERSLVADSRRPARSRSKPPPLSRERGAMLRLAVLGGVRELLAMNDFTLARTRLLVAEARLRAALLGGGLPGRLAAIMPSGRTDPFSGDDLVYRRDGREYAVYSVGADGKDDGGQSDPAGETPDLRLER